MKMKNDQEFLTPGSVNYLHMNDLEALLYVCTAQGSADLRIRERGTCEVCVRPAHRSLQRQGELPTCFAALAVT